MHVSEAAAAIDARHLGADAEFTGAGTDSRSLEPGALFVALRGPRFDGHAFVEAARTRGAAAAMVETGGARALPTLVVPDTRRGLARLAGAWRGRFALPMLAVTGSNGKTTVKEMLAAILRNRGPVLATRGNLNNEVGLPLTLLLLDARHRAAVVEMGASHAGEIARLAELARPAVGVVTNVGPAHLEGFGSLEGVARAKGELYAHLPPGGVAVINADDRFAGLWQELAGARRTLRFGLERPAEVSAEWQARPQGSNLVLHTPEGRAETPLPLPGRHNVMNALAATAAALAAGIPLADVAAGLAAVRGVSGRLELKAGAAGARLLDDTYNANPASLAAALEVLGTLGGRRWLVLGDMGELGAGAAALHREAAGQARAHGVERLFAIGPLSRHAAEAFGEGARHFEDAEELAAALRSRLAADVAVLVKGSRAMRMERVVAALAENG